MRNALAELNADMMQQNPDYVVRITGGDIEGKKKLKYFISVGAKYPVIATTSKLLSTGADYQKGTIENGCARYRSCQPEAYRQLTKEVLALEKQREEHRAEIGR